MINYVAKDILCDSNDTIFQVKITTVIISSGRPNTFSLSLSLEVTRTEIGAEENDEKRYFFSLFFFVKHVSSVNRAMISGTILIFYPSTVTCKSK